MSWEMIPTWEFGWIVFNFISIFVLIIILYVIVKARQANSSLFRGPFFTICLIQGTHEILMFCSNNFVSRLRKYRLINYPTRDDDTLVMCQYITMIFIRNNLYLGHILIASNRLNAFAISSIKIYDQIWTKRNIILATFVCYLINITLRLCESFPPRMWPTWVDNKTDIFGIRIDPYINTFDTISEIVLSVGTAITCAICYSIAACLAKNHVFQSTKYKKQETLLLRLGVFTFFTFIPIAIRAGIGLFALATNNVALNNVALTYMSVTVEVTFVFQPWIYLITCQALRDRVLHIFWSSHSIESSDSTSDKAQQTTRTGGQSSVQFNHR